MTDLGVDNPLYVGDSESDIEAGQRAGIDTVFIRRDHNTEQSLTTQPLRDVSDLATVTNLVTN